MQNKWTIIYTSRHTDGCFLHLDHIIKSNPYAQILTIDFTYNYGWLNPDKTIRKWMSQNISKIKHNNVAFIEYDVLITKSLPDIKLNNILYGRILSDKNWVWWKEIDKLKHLKPYACSIQVFAMYMMSRNCLNFYLDKQYDFLYEQDIIGELRFPTIMNHNGVQISEYPYMNNCHWGKDVEYDINIPDYYHPVKTKVDVV